MHHIESDKKAIKELFKQVKAVADNLDDADAKKKLQALSWQGQRAAICLGK